MTSDSPIVADSPADMSRAEVDAVCAAAREAAPVFDQRGRGDRAILLERMADGLDKHRQEVVRTADRETGLGEGRLNGELTRTCFQLRLFSEVLREGSYLEATIDHAADTPMGPRPDLRRMLVPIGPVAVFAASNFPLAFSVAGGDTASAVAAGDPVVVKAHPSHPATSRLCFSILQDALAAWRAPEGALALVQGLDAGAALVAHPAIRAVGFTGSLAGGRALLEIANRRPDPIPFYGELASLNPIIVTPAATSERAEDLGRGLAASFTLGSGQFCTKPGLILIPSGPPGDRLLAVLAEATRSVGPQRLLNGRITEAYTTGVARLKAAPHVAVVAATAVSPDAQSAVDAQLLAVDAEHLDATAMEECFGPVTVAARYSSVDALFAVLGRLPASLTATIHAGNGEVDLPTAIAARMRDKAGRLIFNGYPTGVAVSWAQHHGGPWPSTNSMHTSVGATAIRRFLRPVVWQDAPEHLLPEELRDGRPPIPRRENGTLVGAAAATTMPSIRATS